MIIVNQIKCLKCGDKPYSQHRHDFTYCQCKTVAVDGGLDYLRRVGDLDQYEELSIELPEKAIKAILTSLEWCDETARNNRGRLCAMARYLRDAGYKIG